MSVFKLNFDGYWRDENSSSIPKINGVYAVYRCTHNVSAGTVTLNELIYMGESEDVGNRIAFHERRPDWKRRLQYGEQICFAVAGANGRERLQIEAALIFKHKPPLNAEYRDAFPFPQTRVISAGQTGSLVTDFTVNTTQAAYRGW